MIIHSSIEQNSDEWHRLRAGVATASAFNRVITSIGGRAAALDSYALTLAAEKFSGVPSSEFAGNSHTERGHELEPEALSAYEFLTGNTVDTVGFITDDAGDIGCSPDGLVCDDGIVEIKCLSDKEHVGQALKYQRTKSKKTPAKFIAQTQGQMLICERKWSDLFFYHPNLPSFIIRQEPSDELQSDLRSFLKETIRLRNEAISTLEQM